MAENSFDLFPDEYEACSGKIKIHFNWNCLL